MDKKIIVLFRNDLRLHDHPALWHAAKAGKIIPVFIKSKESLAIPAYFYWIHYSLKSLQRKFDQAGISFIFREGDTVSEIMRLVEETQADAVYFNESYSQEEREQDEILIHALKAASIGVKSFYGDTLFSISMIRNQQNKPYEIFTSFYRRCLQEPVLRPLGNPNLKSHVINVDTLTLEELKLLPLSWHNKFQKYWTPGEEEAIKQWGLFTETNLNHYKEKRDFPSKMGVSKLSPYLANGNISVRSMWASCMEILEDEENAALHQQIEHYVRQLIWRDFSYYQLLHHPTLTTQSLRRNFHQFAWEPDTTLLNHWKNGQTGYPLVDAGMRELWETGYMHNRVRMVVASFLVKHLLQPWQSGYEWFEQTLLDFNAANNALGWQWVAGTGIDAAPYFRIFNPTLQSEKFDAHGEYIKKWVPELAALPEKYIHAPQTAPTTVLAEAGIVLGDTYPFPIVDHKMARAKALERYDAIKLKS